jgi:hypothetical protein
VNSNALKKSTALKHAIQLMMMVRSCNQYEINLLKIYLAKNEFFSAAVHFVERWNFHYEIGNYF